MLDIDLYTRHVGHMRTFAVALSGWCAKLAVLNSSHRLVPCYCDSTNGKQRPSLQILQVGPHELQSPEHEHPFGSQTICLNVFHYVFVVSGCFWYLRGDMMCHGHQNSHVVFLSFYLFSDLDGTPPFFS